MQKVDTMNLKNLTNANLFILCTETEGRIDCINCSTKNKKYIKLCNMPLDLKNWKPIIILIGSLSSISSRISYKIFETK